MLESEGTAKGQGIFQLPKATVSLYYRNSHVSALPSLRNQLHPKEISIVATSYTYDNYAY